jgi:hypothetical protein
MVNEGLARGASRWLALAAYAAAICLVLPLFALVVGNGFRLALTDEVLSVIAATEQPLSVRSTDGAWALLLALAWFGLAYWQRRMTLWEAALVVLGGAAILARLGNAWLFGMAMVVPLGRQLSLFPARRQLLIVLAGLGLVVSAYTLVVTRPPALPAAAERAALASTNGAVFADWRWAPGLQRDGRSRVLAAGGLVSEPPDFWVDYVRIIQGHERWAEALKRFDANLVVLDTTYSGPAADLVRTSADWRVTFDGDGALVAERVSP